MNGQLLELDDGETLLIHAPEDCGIDVQGGQVLSARKAGSVSHVVSFDAPAALGFKRMHLQGSRVSCQLDIVTSGSRRALERLLPAIPQVSRWLPRLQGAFVYLDSENKPRQLLDPTRVITFARDAANEIDKLVGKLQHSPATRRTAKVSFGPTVADLDIRATEELLLRNPDLLEPHPKGQLTIHGTSYAPRLIANRVLKSDILAPENRILVTFLKNLDRDCGIAAKLLAKLGPHLQAEVQTIQRRLRRILKRSFLAGVPGISIPRPSTPPTSIERTNAHYRDLRRLRIEYQNKTIISCIPTFQRKHVASADKVYQAWCCYLISHALGLSPTKGGLNSKSGPSFENDEWELFYERSNSIYSWRSDTARPDGFRPYILLRRKSNHKNIILVDAKYAVADEVQVGGDRIKEVQAYLNAFGIRAAAIMHPGETNKTSVAFQDIASSGHRIVSLGLTPKSVELSAEVDRVRKYLFELQSVCGETFPALEDKGS